MLCKHPNSVKLFFFYELAVIFYVVPYYRTTYNLQNIYYGVRARTYYKYVDGLLQFYS